MTGLHLSRLVLSHFRSHRQGAIEVDPRPVAIYGPNGAGKTNILEAVSLFSPGRGLRGASAETMARRPEALGWRLLGELLRDGRAHEIEIRAEPGAARQLRIDDKAAAQSALGRLSRVLWLVPSMDRLWIEGAEGRRRFLDRMTLSFFPDHGEAVLSYDKAMRERNRLLKDQVRDPHWYAALEAQMARAGTAVDAARRATIARLHLAQDAAATAFPVADLTLVNTGGPLPDDEAALRSAIAGSRTRDLAAGRSLVGPHRADLLGRYRAKNVDAAECSTGEQKALLVSLILANARALRDDIGAAPLLLLDEVAAHLDATRRGALYDEICALGAQAWMTGTGVELFESLGARAQYLEVTDSGGGSEIAAR